MNISFQQSQTEEDKKINPRQQNKNQSWWTWSNGPVSSTRHKWQSQGGLNKKRMEICLQPTKIRKSSVSKQHSESVVSS